MAGETKTITIAPGVEINIKTWSKYENDVFDHDYPKLVEQYSNQIQTIMQYRYNPAATRFIDIEILERINRMVHPITSMFMEPAVKEAFRTVGQAAKNDISPEAGQFEGMNAITNYGMQIIRPDYLVPTAQGRTFAVTTAGLTANSWYGLWHNGAIGAAYNATPLYLRKELALGVAGVIELTDLVSAEEVQFEIDTKQRPIYNLILSRIGDGKADIAATSVGPKGDLKMSRFPQVEYIQPAKQYRSQFKTNTTGRAMCVVPLGIVFAKASFLRATAPTQPSTTAP